MSIFKPKFMIPLAILVGALTTYAAYKYLQAQKNGFKKPKTMTHSVVVAAKDLVMGSELSAENTRVVDWPEDLVPEGSFSQISDLNNRVLKTNVVAKEVIIDSKLAPTGSGSGFSARIPVGKRAATVPVDVVSGVSGFINAESSVDVLVTVAQPGRKNESITKVILENVEVLAVDQNTDVENDKPMTVQSVTLLVTKEEAEKLHLAVNEGKLSLTLRNSADSTRSEIPSGIRLGDLIAKRSTAVARPIIRSTPTKTETPEPEQITFRPKVVEIIRANERSEITFNHADSTKKTTGEKKKK